MKRILTSALAVALMLFPATAADKHRTWLDRANADKKTVRMTNPYQGEEDAARAGGKLYQRYCSSCHGADANGIGTNPLLLSPGVKKASSGALYWLLRNGSLKRGMPSWSSLPPEQRWQIVTWMKALESPRPKQ